MKNTIEKSWIGKCYLEFFNISSANDLNNKTIFKSKFSAPYKILKSINDDEGRCILPLIHTAGGIVGGDVLELEMLLNNDTKVLLTTTSAQKIYGSVGISKINPDGIYSIQKNNFRILNNSHLEYIPQESIIFSNGLFSQETNVRLAYDSSFLYSDLVRLGRTSVSESIEKGVFRSKLRIKREDESFEDWEFIDQIELNSNIFKARSGMDGLPVFGSIIWVCKKNFPKRNIDELVKEIKKICLDINSEISISYLENGISLRFLGNSTQEARNYYFSISKKIRNISGFSEPNYHGVWPLQDTMNY